MMRGSFPAFEDIADLIRSARREDMGDDDVTSRLLIPAGQQGRGVIVQKQAGVACGLPIVPMVCGVYDARLKVEPVGGTTGELEGRYTAQATRTPLLRVSGPLRSLLSAERTMLNFLQRLSGVATLTHRYVAAVAGTGARIYDTRKTTPGWRVLEKYAVRCGGGENHRMGLFDGLLVKDNHIATIPLAQLAGELSEIVQTSRSEAPHRFIQIEVDTLGQLKEVLKVQRIDSILLDNMDPPSLRAAVAIRDAAGRKGQVALESSGGVNLTTVRAIAEAGVDRISVGAITHSATALDLGLDVEAH